MATEQEIRFGIGIPAYNAVATLRETLDALMVQTWPHWEAVVVDDGSLDETAEIAAEYAARDRRIRLVRQANAGCGAARNVGLRATDAPYLCRLDADDFYLPQYLERYAEFIQAHPGFDIYSCNGLKLMPDGEATELFSDARHHSVTSFDFGEVLRGNPIFGITVLTRDIFDRVGGFPEHLHTEDYGFWLRALASGARHIHMPETLAVYRVSPGQMTADPVNQISEARRAVFEVCDTLETDGRRGEMCAHARRLWDSRLELVRYESLLRSGSRTGLVEAYRGARLAYMEAEPAWRYIVRGLFLVLGGSALLSKRANRPNGAGAR